MKKNLLSKSKIESLTTARKLLVKILVPFVAIEFIILRVLMRMGAVLPKSEVATTVIQWLGFFGEIAFNLSFLLSSFALILLAVILLNKNSRLFMGLAITIFSVLLTNIVLYITSSQIISLAYNLLSFTVFILVTYILRRLNHRRFLFVFFIILSYICTYYFKIASSLASIGLNPSLPIASEVFSIGELLSLCGSIFVFFIFIPKRNLLAYILASSITAGFVVISNSFWLPLLSTWTLYFTLHLPILFYSISLWAYIYVVTDLLKRPKHRQLAYGLLLIGFSGRMLQTTYYNQLALLGFLLLSLPFYQETKGKFPYILNIDE